MSARTLSSLRSICDGSVVAMWSVGTQIHPQKRSRGTQTDSTFRITYVGDMEAVEDISFEDFPRGIASALEEESRKEQRGADSETVKCRHCSYSSVHASDVEGHEGTHTREGTHTERTDRRDTHRPNFCEVCSIAFTHESYLMAHMKSQQPRPDHQRALERLLSAGRRRASAGSCKGAPAGEEGSEGFSVAKQEEDCSFQYFPRSTAVSSEERRKTPSCRAKKTGRFQCKFCDYCSNQSCHVEAHERTHTGEKPQVCPLCSKSFAGKSSLRKHVRYTHKDRGIYECSTCGAFVRQDRLREHEMAHAQESACSHERQLHGTFQCKFCDYCSNQLCHVEVHERTHTGEKPHLCPLCPKSFAGKGSLRQHIRYTHKERDIYECSTCGSFLRQERLREHEMAHAQDSAYSHERHPDGRF
ncbi:zinc finger protein 14-like isoform X2 [Ornithodoros turicata]|uniref:zinc finger protein 14-like isoform X2 n=1 Tax=Ornithodoros turicata TaxID=34597 RepID=UPI00313934BB